MVLSDSPESIFILYWAKDFPLKYLLVHITITKVLKMDITKLRLNEANLIERAKAICVC